MSVTGCSSAAGNNNRYERVITGLVDYNLGYHFDRSGPIFQNDYYLKRDRDLVWQ